MAMKKIIVPLYCESDSIPETIELFIKHINSLNNVNNDLAKEGIYQGHFVSLILPAYNEEEALPLTIDEYINYVDEIIIVDDGSKDNTEKIAADYEKNYPKVHFVKHEKNCGKPAALKTGVSHSVGDIVIFTDADCTYPARYIPEFVRKINKGAEMVIGVRQFNRGNIRRINLIGNRIFSILITYFCYTKITDAQSGFRAMKRDMFEVLDVDAKNLEYETKMTMRAAKLGYHLIEVPIEYRKRVGKSKLHPIKDGFRMIRSIIMLIWNESTFLLKTMLVVNIILFAIGLFFGLYSIYEKIFIGYLTHEYYPLLAVIGIISSMQLIGFSIIMEFIINKLNKIEEIVRKDL